MASASCRDRTLKVTELNGVPIDYYFKIIPETNCDPVKVTSTTEGRDEINSASGGWAISGRVNGGTDKFKFDGVIDDMRITQVDSGNGVLSFDANLGNNGMRDDSWYDVHLYAESGNIDATASFTTHFAVQAENDHQDNLEDNDTVDSTNNTVDCHLNGGWDYVEGKGQILGGNIAPREQRTVRIEPQLDA